MTIPIITAHLMQSGNLRIYCPHCGQAHEGPDIVCGCWYTCPNEGKKLKLNETPIYSKTESNSRQVTVYKYSSKTAPSKETSKSLREQISISDSRTANLDKSGFPTPPAIKKRLDQSVIGQHKAKMPIAVAIYYQKLSFHFYKNNQPHKGHSLGPIMLAGPTGIGKTFLIQRACQIADLPFIHVDTSTMVEEGIVGFSINDLGKEILRISRGCSDSAAHAVVFLDECDKLVKTHFGSSVLSQLLRILEGTDLRLCSSRDDQTPLPAKSLPTNRMLFFLGGAFQWIAKNYDKKTIGFGGDTPLVPLSKTFLSKSGLPKEFSGRIRNALWLDDLTEQDLYEIMTRSDASPLHDYINTIREYVEEVNVDNDALLEIAKIAHGLGYGARSLHHVLHQVFSRILFKAPTWKDTRKLRITIEDVKLGENLE